MIDVVKKTPREYSEQSRDFQVLARLYTALFNISKMYADDLKEWVPDIDNKLTTLRSRTVNFVNRHEWDLNDLEAITSCFKYLMRRKGTETALEACINILMKARGIETGITVDSVLVDRFGCINIWIAHDNILMGIMEDLIRYLIPTGMIYRIYNYDLEVVNAASGIITDIYYRQDKIVMDSEGNHPYTQAQIAYPFNQAMLVSTNENNTVGINTYPTGAYKANIENTFIYNDSEGYLSTVYVPRRTFTQFQLYVMGRTLYVIPEEDEGGVVTPVITYNSSNNTLSIGTTPTPQKHDPKAVEFRPDDPDKNEGTVVWNRWD